MQPALLQRPAVVGLLELQFRCKPARRCWPHMGCAGLQRRTLKLSGVLARARSWKLAAQGATEPVPQVEQQQVSAELVAQMRASISEALEAERVDISDTYGDGRHVSIDVVSRLFEGQSAVKRQRMVYKAIWLELQSTVHAVDAMTTRTPEEAAAAQA